MLISFLRLNELNLRNGDLQDKLQERFQMPGIAHDLGEHIVIHQGQFINSFDSVLQGKTTSLSLVLY